MGDTRPHGRKKKKARPTAAQRAAWKIEKQARGSDEPIEGRCGRKLGGTDPPRYCKNFPAKGRRRCKTQGHGGDTKRGAESPAFVHGQRSSLYADVLGGALQRGYEAIQTDEELLSCREQIKLWTGRERQLIEQLSGGTTMNEKEVRESMAKVDDVGLMPSKTDDEKQKCGRALAAALDEHRLAVGRLADDELAWRQVEAAGRMLVRFRREERRLMEAKHLMMSIDKVLYLIGLVTAVAMKYMIDPVQRAQFCEDAKLLAAGHPVDVDAQLLDAVPFGRGR